MDGRAAEARGHGTSRRELRPRACHIHPLLVGFILFINSRRRNLYSIALEGLLQRDYFKQMFGVVLVLKFVQERAKGRVKEERRVRES